MRETVNRYDRRRNQKLESMLKKNDVRKWELAEALGVSPTRLSIMLRHELDKNQMAEFKAAINRVLEEREV